MLRAECGPQQSSQGWSPSLYEMASERTFDRQLGHEVGALMNGFSIIIRPQRALCFLCHVRTQQEVCYL